MPGRRPAPPAAREGAAARGAKRERVRATSRAAAGQVCSLCASVGGVAGVTVVVFKLDQRVHTQTNISTDVHVMSVTRVVA